jgi:hypothetical protein
VDAPGDQVDQPFGLGDGHRDEPGIVGRLIVRAGRIRRQHRCERAHRRGGDRTDGERGHARDDMAQQGGLEPDLALVETEVALAGLMVVMSYFVATWKYAVGG